MAEESTSGVVGIAEEGKSAEAKHTHPVKLTGEFKREESRESEHRKEKKAEEGRRDSKRR